MAKTIYESTGNKLVNENIDEIVLRLLGLTEVYDLDYDEYKSLLKEAMTIGRMNSTKMASGETEKLTDEYKRIKRKEGRFKVKGKKVNASSFVETETKSGKYTPTTKRLPGTKSSQYKPKTSAQKMFGFGSETTTTEEVQDTVKKGKIQGSSISKTLASIESTLQSILSTLTNQEKIKDKAAETARKNAEKEKKRDREEGSESKILKSLKGVGQKVIEPVKGLFDVILDFFKNILLGALAVKLLKILEDPHKFFRDLINPVIDFFNGFLEGVYGFTVDPINGLIDTINDALKSLTDTINNIPGIGSGEEYQPIPLIPKPLIPKLKPPPEEEKPATGMAGGGAVTNTTGEKISGMGADTQMVALQPGEVVMSKKAVDAYGANNLLAMNANAGGTNKPTQGSIPGYSGGGMVGFDSTDMMGSLTGMNQSAQSAFSSPAFQPQSLQQQSTTPQKPQLGKTPVKAESKPSTPAVPESKSKPSSGNGSTQASGAPLGMGQKQAFATVYELAKKHGAKFPEIVAAQAMHETGYMSDSLTSVFNSTGRTNAFGQTGDRGYGTIPRKGFSDGWTVYPSLDEAVKDNIKLWHRTANHPGNYEAFDRPIDGIASVAPIYSPNADPANIRLGYTVDAYSGAMTKIIKSMGFDPYKRNDKVDLSDDANLINVTPSSSPSSQSSSPSSSGSSSGSSPSSSFPNPTPSTSAPVVSPGSSRSVPGPRNKGGGTSVIPIPAGGGQQSPSSGSSGSQSAPSGFSPIDLSNPEILVVKSIYNIVG